MGLEGKWKAIVLGGLITGLAPFIPVLNLACCIYPILGGFVAVAVYRGTSPAALETSDGVTLGALSGLAGTALYAVLVVPVTLAIGSFVGGFLRGEAAGVSDVPENVRPVLDWIFSHLGAAFGLAVFVKILGRLALSLIFGILGGVAGVALFKSRRSPPPPEARTPGV